MSRPVATPVLSAGQAARILGMTPDGVRKLADRGELSSLPREKGVHRRFRESEVLALADRRARSSVACYAVGGAALGLLYALALRGLGA